MSDAARQDIQPGKLYLGRAFALDAPAARREPFLLSARDLTAHAVCLGMQGAGKTGLGICLLEEALLQGIPALVIDPKGDLTNLALTIADLAPAGFEPWLDAEAAARQGVSLGALAAQTSAQWRDGLAASGIGPERVSLLRDRAVVQIYTPGSDAGIPVAMLQSLSFAPSESNLTWERSAELLRERIAHICSAILGLAGIESDALTGREHILLATIFESAWRAGQSVDIAGLIRMIQDPPVTRVGAFDMNVFYPRAERSGLAMALNTLAASPSFAAWQTGSPVDMAALLQPQRDGGSNPAGRTRASVFSLAHLSAAERQFCITLLLSQVVMWMRAQPGASVLRCFIYIDEASDFCPPFPRNPPAKAPLLAIVQHGRAAGIGAVLATRNPAGLDYEGLADIGTWFIGRLRTARDRNRALQHMQSAGIGLDRAKYEGSLRSLPPRAFLAQRADSAPRFFQTRWTMSFLRGPLTPEQIRDVNRTA